MIRLKDLSLPLTYNETTLRQMAAKKLHLRSGDIRSLSLYRRSIDARRKDHIHFLASVDLQTVLDEAAVIAGCHSAELVQPYRYDLPPCRKLPQRPVIVGSGPCGLFAALILAQSGQEPIIIERGRDVDRRTADVERFRTAGQLDTTSNVQFGEGGAGTFSDGKLNTGTKDTRIRKVLMELAVHGAPEEILYLAKPHIGTDRLRTTVRNIRQTIVSLGGTYHFETQMTGLRIKEGQIVGAEVEQHHSRRVIETDHVILAIGHSARDTFEQLLQQGVRMEQKPFAMGVRIEHLQEQINRSQYGDFCRHPALGAADYKLAVHLPNGRGVYTFCMCPGGTVVAAASEEGRLVTNGRSEFARDKINANAALLVGVHPDDFGSEAVLAGVALQRQLEQQAFETGGGGYCAPVQRVGDFLRRERSVQLGEVRPSYQPGYMLTDLDSCLPAFMTDSLREGLLQMERRLHGFAHPDAILTAVESRSSSPVRILRDDTMQSVSVKGLYPCGEGAGYAGGITSAAVDGIKAAEVILQKSLS